MFLDERSILENMHSGRKTKWESTDIKCTKNALTGPTASYTLEKHLRDGDVD